MRRSIVFGGAFTAWSRYVTNDTKAPTVRESSGRSVPVRSASQAWNSPQITQSRA